MATSSRTILGPLAALTALAVLLSAPASASGGASASAEPEPPAGAKVFNLTYGPCTDNEMFLPGTGCQLGPDKPDGLTAEPKCQGKLLYGSLRLGPKKAKPFLVALDPSAESVNKGMLYIDRDQDGDLAEEKPVALAAGEADLELAVAAGDKTVNHLYTAAASQISGSIVQLVLRERGAWKAKVQVAGQSLDIRPVDSNANGLFNDPFVLPEPGKSASPHAPDMILTQPFGPAPDLGGIGICPAMMALGGTLYDVDVAADASSVTFAPHAGRTASLTAPDGLSAILSVAGRMLTVTVRDGKLLVPAGRARLFAYGCRGKDANGVEWALMSSPDPNAKPFEVPAGSAAAFPAGLPLRATVKANVQGKLQPGSEVSFSVTTTDAAGNQINIQPVRNKDAPLSGSGEPPPTVIVIRQGEKVLHGGKCGFG
jgi:hypothetical protein